MANKCKSCQSENDTDDIFCQNCGRKLKRSIMDILTNIRISKQMKEEVHSNPNNSNLVQTQDYQRGIIERIQTRNKADLLLLFSLLLNIVTPFLFYNPSLSLYSLNNLLVLISAIFIIIPMTLYEPKSMTTKNILFLLNFYLFEYSLFTLNLGLFFISVYQIIIKGFTPQLYESYSNIQRKNPNTKFLKIMTLLILFSLPRIIQVMYPNPNITNNNSIEFTTYFLWIFILSIIMVIFYIKLPDIRKSKLGKLKISQTSSFAILFLVIIGIGFFISGSNLARVENASSYSLKYFTTNSQGNIAYLESYVSDGINQKNLLVVYNLQTHEQYSREIPSSVSLGKYFIKFISNTSVLFGYHNDNTPYYNFDPVFYNDGQIGSNYSIINFSNGKSSSYNFTADTVSISNQVVWALSSSKMDNSTLIKVSSVNQDKSKVFNLEISGNVISYYLSQDMTKLDVMKLDNVTDTNSSYILEYYNLLKQSNSTFFVPNLLSKTLINYDKAYNLNILYFDESSETIYYENSANTLFNIYSYSFPNNKTELLATKQIFYDNFGSFPTISFNQKHSLLFKSVNFQTYHNTIIYSLKNNYSIPVQEIINDYWDPHNLMGITQNNNQMLITTLDPVTFEISQQSIPFAYLNQEQVNFSKIIYSIIDILFFTNLFLCLGLFISDTRKYIINKNVTRENSIPNI